jgi:cell division protease FtsH
MVMKEDERRLTAYHEAGHAICAMRVKGNDPLHKVTIVPRGRALGLAFTLPEDDRVSITREQLKATLVKAYGGRAAEELVFGKEHVTTGAASDIQQATNIARRYVSQWGLSDVVGPILVGDDEQELFLGREIQSRRHISSSTAQTVDAEISKVIREAYQRATDVLTENLELLHSVAAALLERETLSGDEVRALARGETLPPPKPSSFPPAAPAAAPAALANPKPARPPLFGGPEIAPA